MKVVVTTWSIRHAKLQSKCHQQETNIQFLYRPDAFPVAQPCQSTEDKGLEIFLHLLNAYPCRSITFGTESESRAGDVFFVGGFKVLVVFSVWSDTTETNDATFSQGDD